MHTVLPETDWKFPVTSGLRMIYTCFIRRYFQDNSMQRAHFFCSARRVRLAKETLHARVVRVVSWSMVWENTCAGLIIYTSRGKSMQATCVIQMVLFLSITDSSLLILGTQLILLSIADSSLLILGTQLSDNILLRRSDSVVSRWYLILYPLSLRVLLVYIVHNEYSHSG